MDQSQVFVTEDRTPPPQLIQLTNENIRQAVKEWCTFRNLALTKYGPIGDWNTSAIISTKELFANMTRFNDDISRWDMSNVTNMSGMFNNARLFNQDISDWNVSKGKYQVLQL